MFTKRQEILDKELVPVPVLLVFLHYYLQLLGTSGRVNSKVTGALVNSVSSLFFCFVLQLLVLSFVWI